jgi:hypothetical protein
MNKNFLAVALLLVATSACQAQTSCSPIVPAETCKAVAETLDHWLDRGFLQGAALSLEVLTPNEFVKRRRAIESEDEASGMAIGGLSLTDACVGDNKDAGPERRMELIAMCDKSKYQLFENGWDTNVMFLRPPRTREPFPTTIVVSTEEFEDSTDTRGYPATNKDGTPALDGKFHKDKVFDLGKFVGAYLQGMRAVFFDSEVVKRGVMSK